MKSFSNMSQGDLIIIRDALKEVIIRQKKIKLFTPDVTDLTNDRYQEYIDDMVYDLNTTSNRIARIGELLEAIDDSLHQDDSE